MNEWISTVCQVHCWWYNKWQLLLAFSIWHPWGLLTAFVTQQSTLPLKPPLIRWPVLTLDISGSLLCPGSLNLTGRTSGQRCGYQTKTPSISSGMLFRSLEFMGPNIFVLSLVTLDLRLKQYQLVSLTLAQNSLSVDRKQCSRWQSFKNRCSWQLW